MSALAILLVSFGVLMIVTRGPLILAPEKARGFYLNLLSKESTIRTFGFGFLVYGAIIIWITRGDPQLAAVIMYYLGLYILIACVLMIIFARPFIGLYKKIVDKFSTNGLRLAGIVSILIGIWVINYALGL